MPVLMAWDETNGRMRRVRCDEDGFLSLSTTIAASDLRIGGVELQDASGTDRARVLNAEEAVASTEYGVLTRVVGLLATLGQVQASPAANTVLDRLKALLTGIVLSTSTNEIGKVNVKHFNVAGTTLTRPANTTAYAANDSISDNGTAGSVTALPVTVSDTNDAPVDLTEILLDTTDTGVAGVQIRLHVFNSDPTASSGVGGGDNAAWSNKKAGWLGSYTGTMVAFSDGCKGTLVSDGAAVRIANVESGGQRLWYQLQTLGAFTPSANSTTFIPRFKGYQGRT